MAVKKPVRVIELPFPPRPPQDEIYDKLQKNRFSVVVAHRRLGKTVLAIRHTVRMAMTAKRPDSFYVYMAPFQKQAEQVAWGYLKKFAYEILGTQVNQQRLTITFANGSKIRVLGADNPDALRGMYFDGVVLDEVAQMKPEIWGEIIRPALADRKGWALFIGTPKGVNLFSDIYDRALKFMREGSKEWCAMSYSVRQTNVIDQQELEALQAEMSENEFRQEFLCDFNAAADDALIPIDLVRTAVARHYREEEYRDSPLVFGIDIARFGSDSTVIFKRRGLVAFEPVVVRKFDNMQVADMIARMITEEQPDAVFIDSGQGQGVIDRLKQLKFRVTEVPFGGQALDQSHYANRRIEMWDNMAKWLREGGLIPPDIGLQSDLCAPLYGYTTGKGLKILEAKDKIKERLGRSPDLADALALTFAAPVKPKMSRQLEQQLYGDINHYDPNEAFEEYWR